MLVPFSKIKKPRQHKLITQNENLTNFVQISLTYHLFKPESFFNFFFFRNKNDLMINIFHSYA